MFLINEYETEACSLTFLMGHPRPLFRLFFVFFKQILSFLQQINVKNIHPESGAGIQTHDLQNTRLPQ